MDNGLDIDYLYNTKVVKKIKRPEIIWIKHQERKKEELIKQVIDKIMKEKVKKEKMER